MEMPEFSTSFDFGYEIELSVDFQMAPDNYTPAWLDMVIDVLRDGIVMTTTGTVYADGLAVTMFYEYTITVSVPLFGDMDVTIRYWADIDVNDLENPTVVIILELELPPVLQLLLANNAPELNYQFFVMDLSEFVAYAAAELEAYIAEISQEEIDAFFEEMAYELEWIMAEMVYGFEEIFEELMQLWEEMRNYITFSFDYSFGELANGYYAGFELAFLLIDYAPESDGFLDIALAVNASVTNINTAQRPQLPVLEDGSYLDLVALLTDLF